MGVAEFVEGAQGGGGGGEIVAGVGVEGLFGLVVWIVVGGDVLFGEVPGGDGVGVDGSWVFEDGVVDFVGWFLVWVGAVLGVWVWFDFFGDGGEGVGVGFVVGGGVYADFCVWEVVVHDAASELEGEFGFGEDLVDDEGGVVEVCGEVDWVGFFLVVGDADFDVAVGVGFGGEVWALVEPVGDPVDDAVFVSGGGGDFGEYFEPLDVGVGSVFGDGVFLGFFGGLWHVGG